MDAATSVLPDDATLADWKHTDTGRAAILRLTAVATKRKQTRGQMARECLAAMEPADWIVGPYAVALLMSWKGEG